MLAFMNFHLHKQPPDIARQPIQVVSHHKHSDTVDARHLITYHEWGSGKAKHILTKVVFVKAVDFNVYNLHKTYT